MKVIAVVIGYDFKLDTITPTRESAVEYLKGIIDKGFQQALFERDFRVILTSDTIKLDYAWNDTKSYHFLECDTDHMYDNPNEITKKLIPIFRKWLNQQEYPFEGYIRE